jgi:DNA-directed RNA polymerase subunit M/transcription elongation factor TFIIS
MDIFSQLWAYDDLETFVPTQVELSTQLNNGPAAAFCPSCGSLLLDVGYTQADRDTHARTCREDSDFESLERLSDGEDDSDRGHERAQSREGHPETAAEDERKAKRRLCEDSVRISCQSQVVGSARENAQQQHDSARSTSGQQAGASANISQWLQQNDLCEHAAAFATAGVNHELLGFLADEDLKQMGINALGPRRRILAAIQNTLSPKQPLSQVLYHRLSSTF